MVDSGTTATLAIVFADIAESTRLFETHGDVRARQMVGQALRVLIRVTEDLGGTLVKTIGDEVMCTFTDLAQALEAVTRMPAALRSEAALSLYGVAVRIGLQYGDVLVEERDVFGDAVNTAARMVQLARADQVLMPDAVLAHLSPDSRPLTRRLGPVHVRGKREVIEVVEVIWQRNMDELTAVAIPIPVWKGQESAKLVLSYQGEMVEVSWDGAPFRLGRGEDSDLIVRYRNVSRNHASVESIEGRFMLIDHSTNGTYVQLGTAEPIFLHRSRIYLQAFGRISLGQKFTDDAREVIDFTCPA